MSNATRLWPCCAIACAFVVGLPVMQGCGTSPESEAEATTSDSGSASSLTRRWGEGVPEYIKRVISTTLAEHVGPIETVKLTESKTNSRIYSYYGDVVFTNGWKHHVEVERAGNDFGWVSCSNAYWATSEKARFWDSKGGGVSGDDFCKKWKKGATLIEIRVRQNEGQQKAIERNVETFKRLGSEK